jgi:uncharacterized glyoxalase superfamily protein PhnB
MRHVRAAYSLRDGVSHLISNRSVPTDTILPHLAYRDVEEAIAWLSKSFGFVEHYRYGDPVNGAQMRAGNAWIMLNKGTGLKQLGFATQSLTIFIEDVEEHFERTKSAGATITEDLHETEYGELQYGAKDIGGHRWLFSRHAKDVNPEEWGAKIIQPATLMAGISPMLAVSRSSAAIEFYKSAFDANVLWRLGDGDDIVAGLSVHGAKFFLATEAPDFGTRSPAAAGFTTVRIELFVDDPAAVVRQAVAGGATLRSPVTEDRHSMRGPQPIRRMLQGAVVDPFGHMWLIGKILE